MLDPGHGGEDPGAIGAAGSYEKNVTLSIARRLKRKIDAEPNMRAVLTRDGDYFVPLQQRVTRARRVRADLFVSIHADAFVKPEANGSSVYVLSERGASSTAARWLAQRKTTPTSLVASISPARTATSPAPCSICRRPRRSTTASSSAAPCSARSAASTACTSRMSNRRASRSWKAPDIPSVLVETAFISNPQEERRLNDEAYQEKMANALLRGIRRYFETNPPAGTTRVAQLG
ncbi:N-acetylmuramoyl-L-alanine amidase [Thauera humireducens]|uniref:N-acetylmuramoyl-L-alanine amidase family protein n=1 Tax=Thauera humireducens TaxID=1134435 RepID=UPI00311D966D